MRASRENRARASMLAIACLLGTAGCGARAIQVSTPVAVVEPFESLSEYGLFSSEGPAEKPAEGVIKYVLNSALFSDYSVKERFVKLPPGTSARYRDPEPFDFPVGTVIAKTFAYPDDAQESAKKRLIETRILKREKEGWVGLPYVWNNAQTDATLEIAGGTAAVQWIDGAGKSRSNSHIIPNANQCKMCHNLDGVLGPIGPTARQLNHDFQDASGVENQLVSWTRRGALKGAPPLEEAPRLASWNDPASGSLDARARAWLEINCSHCHGEKGSARNSGLYLFASEKNPTKIGVFKPPVAAGRGSGGLSYDIVPGQPDASIMPFRIASTVPDVMMPELGRRLVHDEGLALIREWIAAMPVSAQSVDSRREGVSPSTKLTAVHAYERAEPQ